MRNIAILTIDMQDEFLNYDLLDKKENLILAHKELYELCREKNIPIIYTENSEKGKTNSEIKRFLRKIQKTKLIIKENYNAFTNPKLKDYLQDLEIDSLIITGLSAPDCCFASAQGALSNNFKIITGFCHSPPRLLFF